MSTDDSRAVPDTEAVREALDWFGSDPSATELPLTDTDQRHAATIVRAWLARPAPPLGELHERVIDQVRDDIEHARPLSPQAVHAVVAELDRLRAVLARDVPAGRDLTAQDVEHAIGVKPGRVSQSAPDHLNRVARGGRR